MGLVARKGLYFLLVGGALLDQLLAGGLGKPEPSRKWFSCSCFCLAMARMSVQLRKRLWCILSTQEEHIWRQDDCVQRSLRRTLRKATCVYVRTRVYALARSVSVAFINDIKLTFKNWYRSFHTQNGSIFRYAYGWLLTDAAMADRCVLSYHMTA